MAEAATNESSREEGLLERSRQVREDAETLRQSVTGLVAQSASTLRTELDRRPYRTLSVAAAAGWILGGGLSPRIARVAVGLGGRMFLTSILRDLVASSREANSERSTES